MGCAVLALWCGSPRTTVEKRLATARSGPGPGEGHVANVNVAEWRSGIPAALSLWHRGKENRRNQFHVTRFPISSIEIGPPGFQQTIPVFTHFRNHPVSPTKASPCPSSLRPSQERATLWVTQRKGTAERASRWVKWRIHGSTHPSRGVGRTSDHLTSACEHV